MHHRSARVLRRDFLLTVGAAVGFPTLLPHTVLSAPGRTPPSDQLVTGHIGVGGMGSEHLGAMRRLAAAVCDVDENHLAAAATSVGRAVDAYKDYRRILDRADIDAVVIATPDHWHALQTVHACQAGKDVYVEKPAAKTIVEGRAMVDAATRYGRVVQVGSQGRSTPAAHAACQYLRNGFLGRIQKVTCWHYENPVGGHQPDCDPPPTLDWDRWLGPAPWSPYNPDRCHFNFRWFLDFGGGQIRDRGAHVMSVVLWCMDHDDRGPVRVTATGQPPPSGIWDCPPALEVTYEFKNPDWTLTWSQPGEPEMGAGFGMKFWGEKGTLVVTGGDGGCGTEAKAYVEPPPSGIAIPRIPGHHQDWFNCIRTRERPIMHIEAAHRVASLCVLGTIAYRIGRTLEWDARAERFVNDPGANRHLHQPYRAPYLL
jgi:predicted dehydrogenase